jgi:DNA-binding IclR family transcriptional regulator
MEKDQNTEAFADGTPLVELFGGGARARIISVFVDERSRDLSISEIARQAGVARSTVYDHLGSLEETRAVEHTRKSGSSERYQLADNDLGELLYQLDGVMLHKLMQRDNRRELVQKARDTATEDHTPLEEL